ncbi:alpha-hydroxy acid oxidase [Lacisediminimonas profundi]|uniref:alpha-hydroxy acid oxidase n=1 Tax=Lacisediminimonas profundi TaxID=2603856 RepID=UPI00124BACE0|nr:alpha-hydroxy acid oxidase [Lacisediminimonas profundi]
MLSIADLERAARRRLPPGIHGYVVGGSEDEASLRANRAGFAQWQFVPRPLTDVSRRSQQTELFGKTYASPVGISPMGVTGLCCYDGDRALARAARQAGVPFILSGASTTPMEKVAAELPDMWFQAYIPSRREVILPLIERVAAAGIGTLVVTVDVPIASVREMEVRNGFSVPLRFSPKLIAGGLSRPRWLLQTFARTLLTQGIPHFENFTATRGGAIITATTGDHRAGRAALCWDDMEWLRNNWSGKLVIKGILHPDDARHAQAIGADGIIVSNHGGRQLDGAIAPIDALPDIVAAVPDFTVMIDSGFRRGTDVLKALALGARFVFVGRPAMAGLALAGEQGAAHALGLLQKEIDLNLALLGCAATAGLTRGHVHRAGALTTQQ